MSKQCNTNLPRAISVSDYILEDNGHSIKEAAIEFRLSTNTLERDINYLGVCAFYGNSPDKKELQKKYIEVKKTLARLAKEHNSNHLSKYNMACKKATS